MARLVSRRRWAGSALCLALALIACGPVGTVALQQAQVPPGRVPAGGDAIPTRPTPEVAGHAAMTDAAAVSRATGTTAQPERAPGDAVVPGTAPTPIPLDEFLQRLRALQFAPVLDYLQPLLPAERDDPLFGVDDALAADDATAPILRAVGASSDRLELRWDELEPTPGVFDFARLDDLMATARRLNLSVLAVMDGTPSWAAAQEGVPVGLGASPWQADGSPNPANPWAVFVATVARRYGSQIAAWEIWNEPNSADFWRGTPQQYARLYAVAGAVLTRQVPVAKVLVGGQVSDDGRFLRALASALCPNVPCEGPLLHDVAWHVYDNPADVSHVAALTRAILEPLGITPEVWITEANVPVVDPDAPADAVSGPDAVSLNQQAAFVLQAYTLARAAGVHTLAIYRAADVDDRGHYWGLLRADMTARPALLAYRTAAEWLSHARLVTLSHPLPAVTLTEFCRSDAAVDVVWSDDRHGTTLHIDAPASAASLIRVTGASTTVTAASGGFELTLPAAAPASAATVPLGDPVLLVIPGGCPDRA